MMVLENLRVLDAAPSVQMQVIPPPTFLLDEPEETDPDQRESVTEQEKRVVPENEFYAGDRDNDAETVTAH